MIVRKRAGVISSTRLMITLVAGLAVVLPVAACTSQTKSAAPARASAPAQSAKSLDVDPISGAVTVTPATSLKRVSTVTVSVTGFLPNAELFVGECAHINGLFICDSKLHPPTKLTTDSGGTGSTRFTLRRVFDGFVVAGDHWGQVDCTVYPCYVGVGNHTEGAGSGRLLFTGD
jgi:neocarzinostatin family protein